MAQALTMDDFEFQIIMDEEEGRELEDEEYPQQQQVALGMLCFAGAEEAHQCQAKCCQSHHKYLIHPDLLPKPWLDMPWHGCMRTRMIEHSLRQELSNDVKPLTQSPKQDEVLLEISMADEITFWM
jgi:hypothetical protein